MLDFKTNRVTPETLARVAADYEMQMLVYGLAAERILGSPPASLTLHFLRGGAGARFRLECRGAQACDGAGERRNRGGRGRVRVR